jgi:tripartite ATP-independent transporter DctM subunit
MAVAVGIAFVYPDYAPRLKRASTRERLKALAGPWQFILLFVITIGGIYAGIFSPTEAAAVGAFGSIVLGAIGRRLSWATLWQSIEASIRTSCMLFVIIIGANLFSSFMVQTQFPTMLADGASALNLSAPVVMIMIVLAYIVMGCFLEGIGMVLITVPVFLPLVVKFGYDPIWFSILVVIVVEVGLIHPPVGMNLFVIQAQAPDVRITFTPHLVPLDQGELVSCYVTPANGVADQDLDALYSEAYGDERFVELVPMPPGVRDVRETNICRISVHRDERTGRIVVFGAIDNLWKGAASQAVQNLNLMFGRPEGEGIE